MHSDLRLDEALGYQNTDKRIDILRRVDGTGSISEAARQAGVSYKAAWQAIETLANLAGDALVEKVVGGSGGGGARVTAAGRRLLRAADLLVAARQQALAQLEREDGSPAGTTQFAGLAIRTSMRNQVPCSVRSLKRTGAHVRVGLVLGNGVCIYARITRESAELLGLARGQRVLALWKATAAPIAALIEPRHGLNLLSGTVLRLSPVRQAAEVVMELAPGLQVVGFASAIQGLEVGAAAQAAVDESAIVIAVPG